MLTILREHQWGVVFRLGRIARVARPGLVWLIPILDKILVVDLDRTLPGWKGVSERELEKQVEFVVMHYPEIPVGLSQSEVAKAMDAEKMKPR